MLFDGIQLTEGAQIVSRAGSIVQATSKSTAVTLNARSGQIILNDDPMSPGVTKVFLFNNTMISASDVILTTLSGTIANMSIYNVWAFAKDGGALIAIKNIGNQVASEAITINFSIVKTFTV